MLESLQLPILVVALVVMSWAVVRLSLMSSAKSQGDFEIPAEVLRWQTDLKQLSLDLQTELDEKMSAVSELSQAYEQARERLSMLILRAEALEHGDEDRRRLSA